jgi:hypothetical protein
MIKKVYDRDVLRGNEISSACTNDTKKGGKGESVKQKKAEQYFHR